MILGALIWKKEWREKLLSWQSNSCLNYVYLQFSEEIVLQNIIIKVFLRTRQLQYVTQREEKVK